jgi:hypothetical protein
MGSVIGERVMIGNCRRTIAIFVPLAFRICQRVLGELLQSSDPLCAA